MKTVVKSTIIALVPWITAYISYFTFPILLGMSIPSPVEAGGFTIYHGIMDSVAIFVVSYVLFEMM